MTPERWQQIDAIFRDAIRLEGENRLAYLEKACRGDAELRVEVETLLSNDKTGGLLEGSAFDGLKSEELDSALAEWRRPKPTQPAAPPSIHLNAGPAAAERPTVGELQEAVGCDPVTGWLVCVKGCNQGRDYRVAAGRSRIGRDTRMEICIAGDGRISRDSHAFITYDPRHNQFWLSPGLSRGIVYLNGSLLDATRQLAAYDTIELGDTGLQFIPFCGERFQWR